MYQKLPEKALCLLCFVTQCGNPKPRGKFGEYHLDLTRAKQKQKKILLHCALCTSSLSFIHWKITDKHLKFCKNNNLKKFHGKNTVHIFFRAALFINTCSSHSALHIISLFFQTMLFLSTTLAWEFVSATLRAFIATQRKKFLRTLCDL